MALPVWDLRCAKCRLIEPRPAPALSVAEAAALLRSHRCDATPREVWVQPVGNYRGPRELLNQALDRAIVRRSPSKALEAS